MKLKELLKDIEVVELAASSDAEINGISYDSRKTKQGDAFVAITGFETDGYAYIPSAAQKGAAVVIARKSLRLTFPMSLWQTAAMLLRYSAATILATPPRR